MSKRALRPVDLDLDAPGKDITHLFAASLSNTPDARQAESLHIERLLDNPYQPRTHMRDDSLEELARVIGGQGFQGVLVARPHPDRRGYYQLTAGHRRREAARRSGLNMLPTVVQELTDEEMAMLAVTENIQREDLTPLEEGRIYLLMNREMGYKLEQIAREIGKTIGYVYNRVRVAKAPPDVQALVEEKPDSLRAVANLIKVESESERAEIIKAIILGSITTDDIPLYIRNLRKSGLSDQTGKENIERIDADEISDPVTGILGDDLQEDLDSFATGTAPVPDNAPGQVQPTNIDNVTQIESVSQSTWTDGPATEGVVLIDGVQTPVERASFLRRIDPLFAESVAQAEAQARSSRARRSKLSRVLSMLQTFSDSVEDGATLSREEQIELAIISLFASRLCERLGIKAEVGPIRIDASDDRV